MAIEGGNRGNKAGIGPIGGAGGPFKADKKSFANLSREIIIPACSCPVRNEISKRGVRDVGRNR
jgi:hypothetical protein